jgi:protein-S-isoprenylcysteine O-methyltransferase Ste14
MDENLVEDKSELSVRDGVVHLVLSHSYTVFLLAVILGVIFDIFIPTSYFGNYIFQYVGLVLVILGSLLIYWAQKTTNCTKKEEIEKGVLIRDFARGPYKYSRNPTHIGLTIMALGLGLIINSVFSVAFVVVAFLITKIFFVKKEEELLEKRYGDDYCNYKKKVCTWL